jgi:ribosomal protein L11 methyltransferase
MSWQQIKICFISKHLEPIEQQLIQQGAIAVTYLDAEDQPLFQTKPGETIVWDTMLLSCLFDQKTDLRPTLNWLRSNPSIISKDKIAIETVADEAWEKSWMSNFQAIQLENNFWICPSWQRPPDPNAVNLFIDPGLAFGSGSHNTTKLCLRWLAKTSLTNRCVVDYGSGSGILAIAAALLEAKSVIAVDNDPQAIIATKDNSSRNNIVNGHIKTFLPEQYKKTFKKSHANILVANILATPLQELAPFFAEIVNLGGQIVLSGLLRNQVEEMINTYKPWFDLAEIHYDQEWALMAGTRLMN